MALNIEGWMYHKPACSNRSSKPLWLRLIVRLDQRSEIVSLWSDIYIISFKQAGIIPIQMKMNVMFASSLSLNIPHL